MLLKVDVGNGKSLVHSARSINTVLVSGHWSYFVALRG